jgi:2-dehydro-3-deoxygluconokinase
MPSTLVIARLIHPMCSDLTWKRANRRLTDMTKLRCTKAALLSKWHPTANKHGKYCVNQAVQFIAIGECMLEVQANGFGPCVLSYGGDTFNTSVYLRRCASPQSIEVSYATGLGVDPLSQQLKQAWAEMGLNLSAIEWIEGKLPGMYLIETDDKGERSFHFWRESSAARAYFQATAETALEKSASTYDCIYFSGISLAILDAASRKRLFRMLSRARTTGSRVVFDNNFRPKLWPNLQEAQQVYLEALAVCHTAMITLDDHQAVFGHASLEDALTHAQSLNMPEVVIKRGADNTLVRDETGAPWQSVATEKVARVVDTTAAGDSFAAGYLSRRLLGQSAAVAAGFGNQLAAIVIQHRGALVPIEVLQDLI